MTLCMCGRCGLEAGGHWQFPFKKNKGKWLSAKYISGHNLPEVRIKYSGENHPMKRPEVKAKISGENHYMNINPKARENNLKAIRTPESMAKHSGDNNPMKRPEQRALARDRMLALGENNPAKRVEQRQKMRERMKINNPMKRPGQRQRMRYYNNLPEVKAKMLGENNPMKRPEIKLKSQSKVKIFMQRPEIRAKFTGENNWNWKGGITKLQGKIRKSLEYKAWRETIFERDNYTCRECNKKGIKLNVDHYPKSFASIIEQNNIITIEQALTYKEFWDINNGRTLCVSCHRLTPNYLKNHSRTMKLMTQFMEIIPQCDNHD